MGYIDLGLVAPTLNDTSAASANVTKIQAALNSGGKVQIIGNGVCYVNDQLSIPSHTHVYVDGGLTIRKIDNPSGSNRCTIFTNSDPTNGNVDIAVTGTGTLDFNADSLTGVSVTNPFCMGMLFDNVDQLYVGEGLHIRMATKYNLYGSKITNFVFENINIYSDDTISNSVGRDGIHVQGNSSDGVIRSIRGTTNDDFVVLNVRDVAVLSTSRSVGSIKRILIEDIDGNVQRRAGRLVALYGNRADTPPSITAISTPGADGISTVTTGADHGLSAGSLFKIASSNPSGYNTTDYGAYGVVISAPTSTTFTYSVGSGVAAYVGSAVLTTYYDLADITVRGVRGTTYQSDVVGFAVTGDTGGQFGVAWNVKLEDISGQTLTGSSAALITISAMAVKGLTIQRAATYGHFQNPLFWMINSSKLLGQAVFRDIRTNMPYKDDQATGIPWCSFLNADQVIVDGFMAQMTTESSSYVNAFGIGGGFVQELILRNGHVFALQGQNAGLYRDGGGTQIGKLIVDGVVVEAAIGVHISCDNVDVMISNTHFKDSGAGSTNFGARFFGAGGSLKLVNVIKDGTFSQAFLQANSASGTLAVMGENCAIGGTFLYTSSTGTPSVDGRTLQVPLDKVTRKDGAIVYNTNTALGTLGVAGLVVGQGTAASSWHLMSDPTKVY